MIAKLNPHGPMACLYRNFYNKPELPNNLCPYFWKLVIAIICTPFVWPALVINQLAYPYYFDKENYESMGRFSGGYSRITTAIGLLFNALLLIAGGFVNWFLYGKPIAQHMGFEKFYINGIVGVVAVVLAFKLLGYLIRLIPKRKTKELTQEEEDRLWFERREKERASEEKWRRSFVYLAWHAFIAWKDKVCPRIEWKSNK